MTPTTIAPGSWFPIYDPYILGDNCNYEKQTTCYWDVIKDDDVTRLYLAIRDAYPTKALAHTRVLESFADYKEVNIFLRGMVPLVGFPSATVSYERHERLAGESHYPLRKMLALAFDGITSLSNKPIRLITGAGIVVSLISFIGVIWAIVQAALGSVVAGWASTICIVCFVGGVQLICLGVIGEYIGKIYMETKARPRYIISERTWAPYERKYHG